jgi:hypothetical protein
VAAATIVPEEANSRAETYSWSLSVIRVPFAYLLHDAYAVRPSDAWPKWQASERSVDLAERADRAEVVFSCLKE